jgi:hypothetical protein
VAVNSYISVTWQAVPLEKEQSYRTQFISSLLESQGPAVKFQFQRGGTTSLAAIRRRTRPEKGDCKHTVSTDEEKTAFGLSTFCLKETVPWRFLGMCCSNLVAQEYSQFFSSKPVKQKACSMPSLFLFSKLMKQQLKKKSQCSTAAGGCERETPSAGTRLVVGGATASLPAPWTASASSKPRNDTKKKHLEPHGHGGFHAISLFQVDVKAVARVVTWLCL